jgi:ribosomal protein L35
MKTKQAMAKRFLRTKRGVILKRKAGQDHFNAREQGKVTMRKRRDVKVGKTDIKIISQYLSC